MSSRERSLLDDELETVAGGAQGLFATWLEVRGEMQAGDAERWARVLRKRRAVDRRAVPWNPFAVRIRLIPPVLVETDRIHVGRPQRGRDRSHVRHPHRRGATREIDRRGIGVDLRRIPAGDIGRHKQEIQATERDRVTKGDRLAVFVSELRGDSCLGATQICRTFSAINASRRMAACLSRVCQWSVGPP